MSMVMIQVRIMVITMVMIMVNIMVITKMMMMVMTRGRGNIRAHLRPKNETNGPRAVTVGGGSLYLFSSIKLCGMAHSVFYSEIVHTLGPQWEEDLVR